VVTVGVEENKALVRRFYEEMWNASNGDFAYEVFAADYIRHDLRPTQAPPGPEGQKQIAAAFQSAFPDLRFTVDLLFGEGDYVAARWTASGTHTGAWAGQEPTGKSMTFSGVNLFRFRDGKVAEIWNHRDDLGLMQQLGAPVYAGAPPDTNNN
jgi:steroid delta-isomerase-like uncharacterized protein